MTAAKKLATMTLKEYEATPADARIEVIDGVVYDMAGASIKHQRITRKLLVQIDNYLSRKKGPCEVFDAPTDVKFRDRPLTIVQPDVFVVCDPKKINDKRTNGAPDWIIEVVSPSNIAHDYLKKLNLYREYRVKEYWIVDPAKETVMVYLLNGPKKDFDFTTYTFQDKIPVTLYPDFSIDFAEIAAVAAE